MDSSKINSSKTVDSKQKFRVGIVGCGTISRIHAEVIRSIDRMELVSACSRSDQKRNTFCSEFGINGYADYDSFLDKDNLDVVVLCTPNGTHLDYGLKAASAGKHLIVEKPLEITVERGKKLIEQCKRSGVSLAVIFQSRFIQDVRKLKQAVDDGAIGQLVMARASIKWFRDQAYYKDAPWRGTLALDGGGALINQAIHTVDLLLWLTGPVARIQAFKGTLTHEGIEGEDNIVASIHFKNGALGVLEASTSIIPAQNRIIELHGTKGTATLDADHFTLSGPDVSADAMTDEDNVEKKAGSAGASSPLAGFTIAHHLAQYHEIINHIDAQTDPPVTGIESLQSLALVQSAYRSAETGVPVSPDDLLA